MKRYIDKDRSLRLFLFGILYLSFSTEVWADSWLIRPSAECLEADNPHEPYENIYEIPRSKAAWAVNDLKYEAIVELLEDSAKAFLGAWYRQPTGKKPYLVRAAYAGPNGRFSVSWCGEDLVIWHSALVGPKSDVREYKTAVIVDLKKAPSSVYVGAMPLDF